MQRSKGHSFALGKDLDKMWTDLCADIALNDDEKQQVHDIDTDEFEESPCYLARCCVCSPSGMKLKTLRDSFLFCQKESFSVGSVHRPSLQERRVFAR